jgi:hypothetical protein
MLRRTKPGGGDGLDVDGGCWGDLIRGSEDMYEGLGRRSEC